MVNGTYTIIQLRWRETSPGWWSGMNDVFKDYHINPHPDEPTCFLLEGLADVKFGRYVSIDYAKKAAEKDFVERLKRNLRETSDKGDDHG